MLRARSASLRHFDGITEGENIMKSKDETRVPIMNKNEEGKD